MKTFADFPRLMAPRLEALKGKRVMMYCTGGIRCEKASTWLRSQGPEFGEVYQLKGGIHRYLEKYGAEDGGSGGGGGGSGGGGGGGDGGSGGARAAVAAGGDGSGEGSLFKGKNFVFDRRVALAPAAHSLLLASDSADADDVPSASSARVVGRCLYCDAPWDAHAPEVTCAVCRELVLACPSCRAAPRGEGAGCRAGAPGFHCAAHMHLASCYFAELGSFSADELRVMGAALAAFEGALSGDRQARNRRRTLRRQRARVEARLAELVPAPTATRPAQQLEQAAGARGHEVGFWRPDEQPLQ